MDKMDNTRRRERRYLRWFAVITANVLAAGGVLEWSNRRNERASELVRDLLANGGSVDLRPPLLVNVGNVWARGPSAWQSYTGVLLRSGIDSDWVRRHDYLADLNVTRLELQGDQVNNATVQRIFEVHQINLLGTYGRHDTDALATLLASDSELKYVYLNSSDLTDAGFRQLPLEQLEELGIEQTKVTARGLNELRRCTRLKRLDLNRMQFSDTVSQTLARFPEFERLSISGPGMTDETLSLLENCQNLQRLHLESTSTPSQNAIDSLKAALPVCEFQLNFPTPQ